MKKMIIAFAALLAIAGAFIATPVFADDPCDHYSGPDKDLICPSSQKGQSDATSTIKNVLNTVYLYVGIISTIAIIIGGVFYITSNGDIAKITKAKQTIIYAAIGLVITMMAFAITAFVTNAIGGGNGSSGGNEGKNNSSQEKPKDGEEKQ